jgi:hypothetical protein
MAHLILFTDANFQGEHKHIFDRVDALSLIGTDSQGHSSCIADCDFPNGVSSIVIFSGNWQFSSGEKQASPFPTILGPGLYPFVEGVKLSNDKIRSLMPVPDEPNMPGQPLNGEAILFEHANFRGEHQHVFQGVKDLDSLGFTKKVSSIVVKSGSWSFYFDTEFDGSYPQQPVFGPGIYPWVEDVGISDNSISSLQPGTSAATVSNSVDNEVILFQYGGFYGPHRHVFAPEANLNADDDDFFNDNVGSLVVLAGIWSFYSDWNFAANYGIPGSQGTYPNLSALNIAIDDMSSLQPVTPSTVTAGEDIQGHVILFQNANFHGPHKHIFNQEDNLNAGEDNSFNDSVSSLVVLKGNWQFFRNAGFNDDYPVILGPGLYPWVEDVSIRNKDMSSRWVVQANATVTGDPVGAHIMLFENANFHGAHKHVFIAEPNLNADDDDSFNDVTSSLAVLDGAWATFGDWNFQRQYLDQGQNPNILGPGLYRWVAEVQIPDNDLTSLQPVDAAAGPSGVALLGHVLLFQEANLRGDHKHVFNVEENLNADDDSSFNDATSSIVVLGNKWFTYRDAQFQRAYDVTLGEGLFRSVENVGITNRDMSSLMVAGDRRLFIGKATINIASGQVPEPVVVDVAMSFLFDSNTRVLHVENGFNPIAVGTLGTIKYNRADDGTFQSDGQINIPNFKITGTTTILGKEVSADTTFTLTTSTAISPSGRYNETGSPADMPALGQGNVTLVAAGNLEEDDFSIKLVGALTAQA